MLMLPTYSKGADKGQKAQELVGKSTRQCPANAGLSADWCWADASADLSQAVMGMLYGMFGILSVSTTSTDSDQIWVLIQSYACWNI